MDFQWTVGKIVQQEMIEIQCDDSSGFKEANKNDDYLKSSQ